ncbi:MAG: hypothetical protein NC310_01990 [Roseburia sp.]|nr:hypothetical protein [Roseburia sp.]MCM1556296.1 hypothetical protein [Anaeroplasma bactoclasticum]
MAFGNKAKEYNPYIVNKSILDDLRGKMKKGSTYVNNFGQTKVRSDFERGVAMGRYQLLCEQAEYYNKHKKNNEPRYKSQGFESLCDDDTSKKKRNNTKYTTGGFEFL